jgi:hypothetical protein
MCRGARVSLLCGVILLSYLVSCVNTLPLILSLYIPFRRPKDYLAWRLLVVPSPPGCAAAPVSTVLPAARKPWPVHWMCYHVPDLLFSTLSLYRTCCLDLWMLGYEKPNDIYIYWGTDLLHPLPPLWLLFDPVGHLWTFEPLEEQSGLKWPCTLIIACCLRF